MQPELKVLFLVQENQKCMVGPVRRATDSDIMSPSLSR
jgi:hypothetical protein